MKTLLYTGYNDAYARLAKITVPRMDEYAARHGLEFLCHREGDIADSISPNEGIYWLKFEKALKLFSRGYDRLIWLDVDQLITNMGVKLPETTRGLHLPKDWGHDAVEPWHFSVCGFIAHPDAVPLFQRAIALEPRHRGKPFPEQEPMREVVKDIMDNAGEAREHFGDQMKYYLPTLDGMINLHGRTPFNCVPEEVCPGKVPEPWAKGDLACHITMVDLPRRVEIAKEILARL